MSEDDLLNRRRILALRFGALALVGFGLGEAWAQGLSAGRVLVRLGWAATALLVAQGLKGKTPAVRHWMLVFFGLVSPGFFAGLLHFSGSTQGVAFASFLATPIVFAVLLRGHVSVAVAVSVANCIAGLALLFGNGARGQSLAEWSIALLAAGGIAIYAAFLHRSIMRSEQTMNTERLRALDLLARSDLARARAEQLALLSHLAAGLAHEINNPLGVITMRAGIIGQLLKTLTPESKPQNIAQHVQGITQSAQRIASVIRELTAVVPRQHESSTCDLAEVVNTVISTRPASRLEIHHAISGQFPLIRASDVQLRRIIDHLLLTATLDDAAAPQVWLSAQVEERLVKFIFEDNGPTLWSAAHGSSLGGDGQRGASSGIGLALIRESLHQWGGELEVAARAGGGARLTMSFQRADAAPIEAA